MPKTVYQEPQARPAPIAQPPKSFLQKFKIPFWIATFVAATILLAFLIFKDNKPAPVIVLGATERSIAISSNGKLLAVGTLDGSLRLVSAETGHSLAKAQLASGVAAVSFGPENSILALAQNDSNLYIFSSHLSSHGKRAVHPHPHDLLWSAALDAAVVVSGGPDEIHPKLEFFPAHPLGITNSTSYLYDLKTWTAPRNLSAPADGSRIAITLGGSRRANVIFYSPKERRVLAASLIAGAPKGIAFSQDGMHVWVISPEAESVTEITAKARMETEFPKSASTSPVRMIAVNESARRAYTTGALTFAEVDLDQRRISRTLELPARSAGIALAPNGKIAYLTFEDRNQIGMIDVQNMKWMRAIELR